MSIIPNEDEVLDTTRCYPRTLYGVDGAYPRDPQYANPITHVGKSRVERLIDVVWWAVGALLVIALFVAAALADGARL